MFKTKVKYLARNDLYSAEKPYSADFNVDERNGAKSRDVFDINVSGFYILHEDTSLTLEDALDRPEEAELGYQAELEQILHKHFPEYTRLEGSISSVWKPLVGPNNDWPLALCDYSTIQPSDVVQADVLHVDRITENRLLYPNDQHRWYYVENQQHNDLIVFRNVDSTGKQAGL
ncbi:MAG: hypothetical protein Q9174_006218 [Haloplaca sp. 1 TL-2023]